MADFSVYPDAIDGYAQLPLVVDLVTRVDAVTVNRLRSAIVNIETELGLTPHGDYETVRARLDAIEDLLGEFFMFRSDTEPTTIFIANDIGGTEATASPTDSISVRDFKEIDFSFLVTDLDDITEIRARILYSLLESPGEYADTPEDWNLLLVEGVVSGIATLDSYTLSLDAEEYPGFNTLPGSFAFRSPIAGLHMMVLIWAEEGSSNTSSFEGIALRRV